MRDASGPNNHHNGWDNGKDLIIRPPPSGVEHALSLRRRPRLFCAFVEVGNYIEEHVTVWEREPMERLAAEGKLDVYFIMAFGSQWLRDKNHLENLGFW